MNKQFEEWLLNNYGEHQIVYLRDYWDELDFVFKWGVYLLFFDSVGIQIEVWRVNKWEYNIVYADGLVTYQSFETRQQAQQEAIKKAFEILENEERTQL